MKIILLSGGSGQRLWPLSNDSRSKQFLKVLDNPETDTRESMVQRVWRQLNEIGLSEDAIIATNYTQSEILKNQLGEDVPIVIEPDRRDTFAAISLAVTYLYKYKSLKEDEVITVLPVDPFVEQDFFTQIKGLENLIDSNNSDLALIGVKPTFPSEKYGYILPGKEVKNGFEVNKFVEKPSKEYAEQLMKKNALWNCGVFAFRVSYILDYLDCININNDYDYLLENYSSIPKNSFDYEVVESMRNIVVTQYNGEWKDLGTWNTLSEEMSVNVNGKGILGQDTLNTHIINELDIPVVVIGIDNAIISSSYEGILVSSKELSPKVKNYINEFPTRPMYEEKRWGWYRVLEYTKHVEGNETLVKRIGIEREYNVDYLVHYNSSKIWTIVKGEGIFAIDGKLEHIRAGDVIKISLSQKHSVKAITDLEIIEVQTGKHLTENDNHTITQEWGKIEDMCSVNIK
ncbi:sugar phosphate nucleotidyltransferase [Terribacillus saccharophilus]|uniref:Mannose-1-phosphate guanylyltransferase n=1 Tax=Terribacillus saccharophilus TaxID=361277 RepID=A0ABX4GXQ4_9BACI|nr:sugar phosphate nucleotidyltransferase [Terribacillus saccharophilus]PAD33592.1 mannose-1-phosphate guanylyltransferase [Terribacillus saccharophilus]PAD95866.1 mannose-1-phosphate guanylyltransferase [Terribacillus saccharophilus]PAD99650.1 mannose-1-phosphate guanylyltransferase [Terribacillus saccharophilus]